MTETVKRYNMDVGKFCQVRPYQSEHGGWVKRDDFARLEQECETLKQDYKEAAAYAMEAAHKMRDAETERDAALKRVDRLQGLLQECLALGPWPELGDRIRACLGGSGGAQLAAPPVVIDRFSPPGICRQRLMANGCAYPKSGCEACGKFSPRWKECDVALSASPCAPTK